MLPVPLDKRNADSEKEITADVNSVSLCLRVSVFGTHLPAILNARTLGTGYKN